MSTWVASWGFSIAQKVSDIKKRRLSWPLRLAIGLSIGALLVGIFVLDVQSSWIEAHILSQVAGHTTFLIQKGASTHLERSADGPYDQRLGLAELRKFVTSLQSHDYRIETQARDSGTSIALTRLGVFPIYHEKNQAGLHIEDHNGRTIYRALYPRESYPDFQSIPPVVVNTLLFIENREILDSGHPDRNPAVQWGRLSKAAFDLAIHSVDHRIAVIGGSTLATQLEKTRHSTEGRTESVADKFRQMASASLRAYQSGPDTLRTREEIVRNYINSIPLAATHQGEVIGLADGLRDWYGADFKTVNSLLAADGRSLNSRQFTARAQAYREVLSLLLALREPTSDLIHHQDLLEAQVDRYLPALTHAGIISAREMNTALHLKQHTHPDRKQNQFESFTAVKGPNAIRMALLPMLGLDSVYSLDRLDLTVRTTLDQPAQKSVSNFLDGLSAASAVNAAGLNQYQLLDSGNPKSVIYSVTLYERGQGANLLRVQTDNFNQPLDINQGTRLQLGSTAKLRTLINYLQIVEILHGEYSRMSSAELKSVTVLPDDTLTQWALTYLSTAVDRSLEPMLEAALGRKYSGSTGESFFTAGGLHHFDNFEPSEDGQIFTVAQGFQHSVNLVFIRLMRDIEHYYRYRVPGASPTVLTDPNDPGRKRYLDRFADLEGRTFLRHFYEKYDGQTPAQSLQELTTGVPLTPVRAAVIFRSVRPQASMDDFSAFLRAHLPAAVIARQDLPELYEKYGTDKFNLNDRGYLAHLHPLELWLLFYREQHPKASLREVLAGSTGQRQEVYQWLFKTRYQHAQNQRIETLLEIDAFQSIHQAWQQLGYPFDSLTPSYATCIGVSGDTPQALATLTGILVNDGVRYPSVRIQQLEFASATPFETTLARSASAGRQVLSPVIAGLVRKEMIGVVENGTGARARGGIRLPDGVLLPIGGKTGTGDNRLQEFGPHGSMIGSKVVSRTAAFVFFIGDRFYGTVLAFVPGRTAGNYNFTSALAVQVLKDLEPHLLPLFDASKESNKSASRRQAPAA
ncbi:MAG TPA: transglycosylase domain-containing protein [Bryobacteraceae bacterium]|jgi:membrane peptidoglycan carboxypeptidase|nr:transglycosylase domain-containing protein [Bryobacteraceae bacterium]